MSRFGKQCSVKGPSQGRQVYGNWARRGRGEGSRSRRWEGTRKGKQRESTRVEIDVLMTTNGCFYVMYDIDDARRRTEGREGRGEGNKDTINTAENARRRRCSMTGAHGG